MDNLLALIFDRLDIGIIILDNHYQITVWNGWLERFTGKSAKDVIGAKLMDVCPNLNQKTYYQIFEDAMLYRKNRFCSGAIHRFFVSPADESCSSVIRQNMLVQPIEIGDGGFILLQIFDITSQHQRVQQLKRLINELTITHQKLKASEETVRYQAYHDSLTGLPNRLLLMDRIKLAIANAQRNKNLLAVLFLDLDHFKLINDTLGHDVGDKFLQNIALRLVHCMRKNDTVARLGGDEFVILLPEVKDLTSVSTVADKIINTIVKPWSYKGRVFFVTASVGISVFPHDGEEPEVLIKNADNAMFCAKKQDKNNYRFFKHITIT